MNILFSSYAFRPSVGGIETVSALLAEQFVSAGHEVELITETPGVDVEPSYRITRSPSMRKLLRLLRWADVFFQNNISLRSLWLAMLSRKRTIIVHQTWIRSTCGRRNWNDFVKYYSLAHVTNVAISRAIADEIKNDCVVIPNPYRDELFQVVQGVERAQTLIFVGRLVSDKGVDLLLRALAELRAENLQPDLTVVGTGPEFENLLSLSRELKLEKQVRFTGQQSGRALVDLLNKHRVLVIPSRWPEPFGVVALEGIACGCAIVGSSAGGLKEAMGACGLGFENENTRALAETLQRVLTDRDLEETLRAAGPAHLARFSARTIALRYLRLMENLKP